MSATLKPVSKKVSGHSSDVRADKLASAVSGFTSSGVGKKVALSRAIERAKNERASRDSG